MMLSNVLSMLQVGHLSGTMVCCQNVSLGELVAVMYRFVKVLLRDRLAVSSKFFSFYLTEPFHGLFG